MSRDSSEKSLEMAIGNILRAGVTVSAVVVAAGAMVYLARHGFQLPHYRLFEGEPNEFCSVGGILQAAFAFRGRGIMQLGLLILILTPILRVVLSIGAFLKQRDMLYAFVALMVFALLMAGLFGINRHGQERVSFLKSDVLTDSR